MTTTIKPSARPKARAPLSKRQAARLGVVQALYQIELSERPADAVIAEFQATRLTDLLEPLEIEAPTAPLPVDRRWFEQIAHGAAARQAELDPAIAAALSEGWSLPRIGYLLRATLRAGAFELLDRRDVPVNVVINEYVGVADTFFAGDEPKFVNAVLDRVAQTLRAEP